MRALGVFVAAAVSSGACTFEGPAGAPTGDGDGDGDGDGGLPWWDDSFAHRQRLSVTAGPLAPARGYVGYTVRLGGFDSAALIAAGQLAASCDDLRLVFWDGEVWTESARHLSGCDSADSSVAFAVPVELAPETPWLGAYLYYGGPEASGPPVSTGNVYLWWDDAVIDRGGDYDRGRMDAWLGDGHEDSLAHDAAGYYVYATGNDSQSSYRRAVDERDVLIEAELFHTGCWSLNMQTGVCVRGIIESGAGATESSDHYYCSTRAQNPTCQDDDQDIYDGDIVAVDNENVALQGLDDPPPIVPDQWRKQALAAFGTNPTQLRFWDSDSGWPGLGFPDAASIQASGAHADDHEGAGFAAVMTAQDAARIRNIVIRRYVEPEPTVALDGAPEARDSR